MNTANAKTKALVKMLNSLGEHDLARRIAIVNVRTQILVFRKKMLVRRIRKLTSDTNRHEETMRKLDKDVAAALTSPN